MRYGRLSVDTPNLPDFPITWDREEFTFAFITYIYRHVKLKTEYSIDRIQEGVGCVRDYGEFLAQLEVLF